MKKTVKFFAVLMAAAMLVACFAGCGNNSDSSDKTYFIGATGPLTGDAMSYGVSANNGATLAVEEINAAGGLNGVLFSYKMKDDKATAVDATAGYNSLMDEGMQISIGSVTSGSCEAFADAALQDNLFFMTPSASAASVIAKGDNAFRVCFGDPDQGVLAAKELTSKYAKIGCIYDTSDTYSSGIYEAFDAEMKNLGIAYETRSFDADNKKDFSTQVDALKDCEVIFLPIYYTEAGLIAKACVAKGVSAELFGCDGLDGVADQIDATVTNSIRYITPFDVTSTEKNVADFVASYTAKFGTAPDQFAADGYDAIYSIFYAMKAAGVNDVNISASDLCEAVKAAITSADFNYAGVTGKMTWDTTGACTKEPVIVSLKK